MSIHDDRHSELFEAILEKLDAVYANTVSQGEALARKDDPLLKRLLHERQALIEEIAGISRRKAGCDGSQREPGQEGMEKSIRLLQKKIEQLNTSNLQQAEKLKNELASKIRQICAGKKAFTGGYYNKMPAQYGSFIDKKVGK